MAAPGNMACAMASPVRLIRRKVINIPTGTAPKHTARLPMSARCINRYSVNGPNNSALMSGHILDAPGRLFVKCFGKLFGAF